MQCTPHTPHTTPHRITGSNRAKQKERDEKRPDTPYAAPPPGARDMKIRTGASVGEDGKDGSRTGRHGEGRVRARTEAEAEVRGADVERCPGHAHRALAHLRGARRIQRGAIREMPSAYEGGTTATAKAPARRRTWSGDAAQPQCVAKTAAAAHCSKPYINLM